MEFSERRRGAKLAAAARTPGSESDSWNAALSLFRPRFRVRLVVVVPAFGKRDCDGGAHGVTHPTLRFLQNLKSEILNSTEPPRSVCQGI